MSDEGLDKIFKEGLANRSVDFNMAAWRNMEQMLPPEPKAVFFTFNRVAAIVGLLLLVGASSFYFWNINDVSGNDLAVNENTITSTDLEKTKGSELNVASTSISAKAEKELTSNQGASNSGVLSTSQVNESNENGNHNSTAVGKKDANRNSNFFNGNRSNEKSNQNFSKTDSKLDNAQSDFISKLERNPSKSLVSSKSQRNGLGSGNSNSTGDLEQQLELSTYAFTQIDGLDELASMTFDTEEEDETIIINVSNGALPKVAKNVVGIIGGININPSLVDQESNKESISEFAGITYQRYMNRGFSLKANLLYSARNGVNTSKLYQDKHYDFGGWTESMEIETKRLVYLELPVMVNYGVKNHNFMAGASFSYLINSLSSVKTASTHPTESSENKNEVWGYNKGFSNVDMSIVAGYEYSVTPKLNLGGRVNYGLIDVTDNSYFNSNSFDNNIQFRVYVTYSPFQF